MKKKLIYLFIIPMLIFGGLFGVKNVVDAEEQQRYYRLGFTYTEENGLEIDKYNIRTSVGVREPVKEPGDFLAKLYSIDNKFLVQSYFTPEKEGDFYLELQYHPTGKLIEIFNANGDKLFEKDVQVFAMVCGDLECQSHESYENCKEDCPSGKDDGMCDKQSDGVCDPDCHNIKDFDPDCTGEHPSVKYAKIREELAEKRQLDNNKTDNEMVIATVKDSQHFKVFMFLVILVIIASLVIIFFLFRKRD